MKKIVILALMRRVCTLFLLLAGCVVLFGCARSPTASPSGQIPIELETDFAKGKELADQAKFSEAIPFLEKALSADPASKDALYYLFVSYSRIEKSVSQKSKTYKAAEKLVKLYPDGDYGKSAKQYIDAVNANTSFHPRALSGGESVRGDHSKDYWRVAAQRQRQQEERGVKKYLAVDLTADRDKVQRQQEEGGVAPSWEQDQKSAKKEFTISKEKIDAVNAPGAPNPGKLVIIVGTKGEISDLDVALFLVQCSWLFDQNNQLKQGAFHEMVRRDENLKSNSEYVLTFGNVLCWISGQELSDFQVNMYLTQMDELFSNGQLKIPQFYAALNKLKKVPYTKVKSMTNENMSASEAAMNIAFGRKFILVKQDYEKL